MAGLVAPTTSSIPRIETVDSSDGHARRLAREPLHLRHASRTSRRARPGQGSPASTASGRGPRPSRRDARRRASRPAQQDPGRGRRRSRTASARRRRRRRCSRTARAEAVAGPASGSRASLPARGQRPVSASRVREPLQGVAQRTTPPALGGSPRGTHAPGPGAISSTRNVAGGVVSRYRPDEPLRLRVRSQSKDPHVWIARAGVQQRMAPALMPSSDQGSSDPGQRDRVDPASPARRQLIDVDPVHHLVTGSTPSSTLFDFVPAQARGGHLSEPHIDMLWGNSHSIADRPWETLDDRGRAPGLRVRSSGRPRFARAALGGEAGISDLVGRTSPFGGSSRRCTPSRPNRKTRRGARSTALVLWHGTILRSAAVLGPIQELPVALQLGRGRLRARAARHEDNDRRCDSAPRP